MEFFNSVCWIIKAILGLSDLIDLKLQGRYTRLNIMSTGRLSILEPFKKFPSLERANPLVGFAYNA